MSKLYNQLAEEIFDTLKGNGKILSLFDKDGNRVFAPTKARRVFCQPDKMMITLDENGEDSQVKMYLSQSSSLKSLQKLISTIRNICTRYNVLFNVRKFGRDLCPKDFAYQSLPVSESVMESLYGSMKTSYQKIGSTRLVIRHTVPVNEEKRGSRSRKIKSIFIETKDGEKFNAPVNLRAARALAYHTSMGGNPYDDLGMIIKDLANESKSLSQACRHMKHSLSEDAYGIVNFSKIRMDEIKGILSALSKPKKYIGMKEALEKDTGLDESEDDFESVSNTMKSIFEDNDMITEYIPYLAKVFIKENGKTNSIILSDDTTKKSLNDVLATEFGFKEGLDYSYHHNNPLVLTLNLRANEEALNYLDEFHPDGYLKEDNKMSYELNIKKDCIEKALNCLKNIGGYIDSKDFNISPFSGKLRVKNIPHYHQMEQILLDAGVLKGSEAPQRKKPATQATPPKRGIVFSKHKKVWEDGSPKGKVEQFCDKWLNSNTDIPEEDLESRAKELAKGIADFMTGKMNIDIKPVDDSRFRSPTDAFNFKVGEVAESNFGNDTFSNFMATLYDKLMHGGKLSGPEKQIADKAASYCSINEATSASNEIKIRKNALPQVEKELEDIHAVAGVHYKITPFGNILVMNPKNVKPIRDFLYRKGAAFTDRQVSEDGSNELYFHIDFPTDGDDTLSNTLEAFLDGMDLIDNSVKDNRRYMTFQASEDTDLEEMQSKVTGLLSGVGCEDFSVGTSSSTEDNGTSEPATNEISEDDNSPVTVSLTGNWAKSEVYSILNWINSYGKENNVSINKTNTSNASTSIVCDVDNITNAEDFVKSFLDIYQGSVRINDEDYELNEFAGDENDWSKPEFSSSEGDMVSTPMGPGHIVEISGDEVKVEMMNGKVNSFHKDDIGGVNESINKELDEWFAQFDPNNIFTEDEDSSDAADSSADEDSEDSDDSDLDDDSSDAADSVNEALNQDVASRDEAEVASSRIKVFMNKLNPDDYEAFLNSVANIYGENIADAIDGQWSGDKLHYQQGIDPDITDLIQDTSNILNNSYKNMGNVGEAFSNDPVGDADRYYGAQQDAQDSIDSTLDKAADDFDADEFIRIYGEDFGMENIGSEYPEDYTVSDKDVVDAIAHYLTRLANRYSDTDVSMEDAKPYADHIFEKLKPVLMQKGLLFTQAEATLPGNVQTDFRKDVSNGLDPALERMKQLAGMKRR